MRLTCDMIVQKKDYLKGLCKVDIPNFVRDRIDYFASFIPKGMTYSDLYLFTIAEPNEEEVSVMFEEIFGSPYLEMDQEFIKWYREPKYWKQRQIELANAVIQIYQQKILNG
ncbi:TPA: hypothetical protein ACOW76_001954 [Enterococcus faecalis]|uniref:hypothetical protein n=1 Tax=Enterococcus faecalis TaxID=1351 RepID=UPI003B24B90B|nr:hypothetical protein [Enterococcus faecalis]